jgi:hypothetical protein
LSPRPNRGPYGPHQVPGTIWYLARSGTWHDQVPGTIWYLARSGIWYLVSIYIYISIYIYTYISNCLRQTRHRALARVCVSSCAKCVCVCVSSCARCVCVCVSSCAVFKRTMSWFCHHFLHDAICCAVILSISGLILVSFCQSRGSFWRHFGVRGGLLASLCPPGDLRKGQSRKCDQKRGSRVHPWTPQGHPKSNKIDEI